MFGGLEQHIGSNLQSPRREDDRKIEKECGKVKCMYVYIVPTHWKDFFTRKLHLSLRSKRARHSENVIFKKLPQMYWMEMEFLILKSVRCNAVYVWYMRLWVRVPKHCTARKQKRIEIFVTVWFGFLPSRSLAHFYTHHSQRSIWRLLLLMRICHFYHFSSGFSFLFSSSSSSSPHSNFLGFIFAYFGK